MSRAKRKLVGRRLFHDVNITDTRRLNCILPNAIHPQYCFLDYCIYIYTCRFSFSLRFLQPRIFRIVMHSKYRKIRSVSHGEIRNAVEIPIISRKKLPAEARGMHKRRRRIVLKREENVWRGIATKCRPYRR